MRGSTKKSKDDPDGRYALLEMIKNAEQEALFSRRYLCPYCNSLMEIDEETDEVFCEQCNESMFIEDYAYRLFGCSKEDFMDIEYPGLPEFEDDDQLEFDDDGEVYDEIYEEELNELDD